MALGGGPMLLGKQSRIELVMELVQEEEEEEAKALIASVRPSRSESCDGFDDEGV